MAQTDKQNTLPYLKDVCARDQSIGSASMNWIHWTFRLNMVLMDWGYVSKYANIISWAT